jgi:hypothetical protein
LSKSKNKGNKCWNRKKKIKRKKKPRKLQMVQHLKEKTSLKKMTILTGKRVHTMSEAMMKRRNGKETWKFNRMRHSKRDKSTSIQWE